MVLTFNPHPKIALFQDNAHLHILSSLEEKVDMFNSLGIDHLIVHPFDKAFSRTSVIGYIKDILIQKLNMKHLVIGYDHHFGKNREGNAENIEELSALYEFSYHRVDPLKEQDINISSTKIRHALNKGNITLANHYLGYTYGFSSKVIHGDKQGREIGFPTANLTPISSNKLIPSAGVYAVECLFNKQILQGVMSIGSRPSFKNNEERIEVHLFDFSQDVYGEVLYIKVKQKLRENKKFDSVEDLKKAIESDTIKAKSIL